MAGIRFCPPQAAAAGWHTARTLCPGVTANASLQPETHHDAHRDPRSPDVSGAGRGPDRDRAAFRQRRGPQVRAGELIYEVGSRHTPSWLVLEGAVDVVSRDGLHHEAAITRLGVGQFSGEVNQLAGRGTLTAGRAGPHGCTVLPFDAAHVRALVIGAAEVGEIVMRAFILRRVGLLQAGSAGSILLGRPEAPDLVRLQGFLARNGYPCTVLDALADEEGRAVAERFGVRPEELPLMICPDGTVLKRPTNAEAGACLGITPDLDPQIAVRRGRGRRRPGRPRDRGLCRLRGPLGHRARPARVRRTGRSLRPDRELSRLSDRHLRPGAWLGARSTRRRNSAPRSPFRSRWRGSIAAAASCPPARRRVWNWWTDAPCGRAPW